MILARVLIVLAVMLGVFGCNNGGADFTSRYASNFQPAAHTVSVLGVYQDGRMSPGGWDLLAPYLGRALGSAPCSAGYDTLAKSNQDLANAIDEFARDEGPTANLLSQIAPTALGDLILVVSLAGKVPEKRAVDEAPNGAPVATGMGRPRRRARGHDAPRGGAADPNELDVSASLFSVAQGRSVAIVEMRYRGASLQDGLTKFALELSRAIPGSRCVAWNFSVKLDPKQIRPTMDVPSVPRE